jgi:multicomponent K+:H+ antiporter subunit D
VRPGLHYIAVNLVASLPVPDRRALLYGVTGTLNMADIAQKLPLVPAQDRGLLHAAAALLAVAFLAKAAFWPLNFWLPAAYSAASAPSAAMFAILTKVGVVRGAAHCGPCASRPPPATRRCSAAACWSGAAWRRWPSARSGMLRSQQLGRLAGYSIITSSGTVIAATGFDHPALTAGRCSTWPAPRWPRRRCSCWRNWWSAGARRGRSAGARRLGGRLPAFGEAARRRREPGRPAGAAGGPGHPRALAFLAPASWLCTLVVAGLPPLSGFVGKVAMLQGAGGAQPATGRRRPDG